MIFEDVFTVRIVYKSGYVHDFECTQFSYSNGTYTWKSADVDNRPIDLGGTEIAAVWQTGKRSRIKWSS